MNRMMKYFQWKYKIISLKFKTKTTYDASNSYHTLTYDKLHVCKCRLSPNFATYTCHANHGVQVTVSSCVKTALVRGICCFQRESIMTYGWNKWLFPEGKAYIKHKWVHITNEKCVSHNYIPAWMMLGAHTDPPTQNLPPAIMRHCL